MSHIHSHVPKSTKSLTIHKSTSFCLMTAVSWSFRKRVWSSDISMTMFPIVWLELTNKISFDLLGRHSIANIKESTWISYIVKVSTILTAKSEGFSTTNHDAGLLRDSRVVYTMKVVSRPCKICDWMLNLSWNHFGLHQERIMLEWPWSSRSPKDIFKAYVIHWHGPTIGEAQEMLW